MANTNPTTDREVTMFVSELTTAQFLALRDDWKAAGCPADHPYMRLEADPRPEFVEPLVVLG